MSNTLFNPKVIKDFTAALIKYAAPLMKNGEDNIYPVTAPEEWLTDCITYNFSVEQFQHNKSGRWTDMIAEVWITTQDYSKCTNIFMELVEKIEREGRFKLINADDNYSVKLKTYAWRLVFSTNYNSF